MDSSKRLAESENFYVAVGPMVSESAKGLIGYGVYNKRTGVREQETNVEAMAIRLLHKSEEFLQKVLADPEDKIGRAEEEAARARHAMLDRAFQMEELD